MQIFKTIPFNFNFHDFSLKINLSKYAELSAELEVVLDKAVSLATPKAAYAELYVEKRTDDLIDFGRTVFKSSVMGRNLKNIERVFAYIATCGDELEDFLIDTDDPLTSYWIDSLKETALDASYSFLESYIKDKYRITQLSSMQPGSADPDVWPVEQQKDLFSLFPDHENTIGVRLTDRCLMIPNKTVSGIFFPTEVKYESCRYCSRKSCPERKVSDSSAVSGIRRQTE